MIDAAHARATAARGLVALRREADPMIRSWPDIDVGEPVCVYTIDSRPSYWRVPLEVQGRVIGFARVAATGDLQAIGVTCRSREALASCSSVTTGLSAEEAQERVRNEGLLDADETMQLPIYVHDGPPGREAWLLATTRGGHPARWFFVTPGGVTQRTAGRRYGEDPTVE